MHFRQKLIFTALGSALTLAGYLLATIVSDVTAQDNKTESLGDIVCDSITVRDGGPIKILDKDDIMRMFITDTDIYLYDKSSTLRIGMGVYDAINGPYLEFYDKSGKLECRLKQHSHICLSAGAGV
jgi:hypothetical protein